MDGFNIEQSFQNAFNDIMAFLPNLLGFLLILVIGYFVAKGLASIVYKGLKRVRFDRAMHTSAAGNYVSRLVESPAHFTKRVVFWLVFLLFLSLAANTLQLSLLNEGLSAIYSYIPRVVAAVLIFLVASAIAGGTAKFVQRVMGRTSNC